MIRDLASVPREEEIDLLSSLYRVLAREVRADLDLPGFDRSTVDGYAVRARDTVGASDALPAFLHYIGSIPMGSAPTITLGPDECAYIATGGVLPEGADAVAMVEYSEKVGEEVLVRRPVANGENVVQHNEDFSKGAVVLPQGHTIRPQDMGVLAAVGASTIPVFIQPRIGVISTGNEVIPIDQQPGPGQVRDINSAMIGGFLTQHGCIPRVYGIVPDERAVFGNVLERAIRECDAVLLSGGSSKGYRDMCAALIEERGTVLVHGIALQPGKPTILGKVGQVPVIGLPGHPASAYIVLRVIVRPLLVAMTGRAVADRFCTAKLAQNVPSSKGREEYVRVRLEGEKAVPLLGKSGLVNTLVQSDGMIRIPAELEGLEAGEVVEVILW